MENRIDCDIEYFKSASRFGDENFGALLQRINLDSAKEKLNIP